MIARPGVLFGHPPVNKLDVVAPAQRMISVTSDATVLLVDVFLILFRSAALIGVVASTGSCEFGLPPP